MCLRIKHESGQIDFLAIVAEQQIEILEGFAEEERFHHVTWSRAQHVLHITDRRVPVFDARVRLERLEYRPAHVLVRCVAGQCVEIVQTFDEFRSQQIVCIVGFHVHIGLGFTVQIEVCDFGRKLSGLLHVRLVARLQQVFGQFQMGSWHSAMNVAQEEGAWKVACEMIHFRFEIFAVYQFANVNMMFVGRSSNQMLKHAVDGCSVITDEAEIATNEYLVN